jgi:hypothetical protein
MLNNIDKDIDTLKTHDTFIRFLLFIEELRDECIAELHESSSEKIQQISGRILSYDQILEITEYKQIKHLANSLK